MTEADAIRIAIEYAKDHGLMLTYPSEGDDFRTMSFWKQSEVFPHLKVISSFGYVTSRLVKDSYEAEFRINCQGALLSLDECEARGRETGVPQP